MDEVEKVTHKLYTEGGAVRFMETILEEGAVWLGSYDPKLDKYNGSFEREGLRYYVGYNPTRLSVEFIRGGWRSGVIFNDNNIKVVVKSGALTLRPSRLKSLGVQDITSLQPHEYGLLKLKYGLDKNHLWIPELLKPLAKALYKRG